MPKYVCDIDQVYACGNDLCQVANEMRTSMNNYFSVDDGGNLVGGQLASDLAGWKSPKGGAKDAFVSAAADVMKTSINNADYINSVGEHIKSVSQMIQSLEEELASFKI